LPKKTDRRRFASAVTTQCEALDPATLAQIVDEAIRSRLDLNLFDAALAREESVKGMLRERLGR
jgi:hypothetical protein